jgi:hypothetical protein
VQCSKDNCCWSRLFLFSGRFGKKGGRAHCVCSRGLRRRPPWWFRPGFCALWEHSSPERSLGAALHGYKLVFSTAASITQYFFIRSCYNLPFLLDRLGWSLKHSLWSYQFGSRYIAVTPQWMLRLAYLGGLALCSLGAAQHSRNRDPRLLIAIATKWLLMFALLGQMHERYLMWGAVVSAVSLGVSLRLSAVHFIISAMSTAMIVHAMLIDKKLETTLRVVDLFRSVRPYASGLLLLCVAVCLWDTVSTRVPVFQRGRRQARPEEVPALSLGPAPGRGLS